MSRLIFCAAHSPAATEFSGGRLTVTLVPASWCHIRQYTFVTVGAFNEGREFGSCVYYGLLKYEKEYGSGLSVEGREHCSDVGGRMGKDFEIWLCCVFAVYLVIF